MHGNYGNVLTNDCDVLIAIGMRMRFGLDVQNRQSNSF
jgi:thiamine pyrophosphate-dependent acetolactate synthase large subunit-like protein